MGDKRYSYKTFTGCTLQYGEDFFSSPHGGCLRLQQDITDGWEPYLMTSCPGGYENKYTQITIMLRKSNDQTQAIPITREEER